MAGMASSRSGSPQKQPAAHLRSYSSYVRQMKDTKAEQRAAGLQEGWLNALRQDIVSGFEASLQQELEHLRQDLHTRLGIMSLSIEGLKRDVGDCTDQLFRASEEAAEGLRETQAQHVRTHEALSEMPRRCCPDLSPVTQALEQGLSTLREVVGGVPQAVAGPVLQAVQEARRDARDSREALLQAIDGSRTDLAPVYACVRENKTIVDFTPVVASLTKSHLHLAQHMTAAIERIPKADLSPVLAAVRDGRPDLTPILKAVYESRTDLQPVLACVRESRPVVDYGPVLEALRANSEQFAQLVGSLAQRPPMTDLAPILAAIREQKPTVDLRAVLAAVRETRAVDLKPVLEAVHRVSAAVDSSLEGMVLLKEQRYASECPYVLARAGDFARSQGRSASPPRGRVSAGQQACGETAWN